MKEQDIRPLNLLEEYLKLSKHDAKVYKSKTNLKKAFCEACDNHKINSAFKKNGFMYKTCSSCQSLLLSPRPNPEKLNTFYRSSKSAAYWANTFFPSVAEIRRKKIFRPRIIKIKKICDQHNLNVKKITEIGSGSGIFLEEWVKKFPETRCTAIEPSRDMAEQCRKKGIHVFEGFVEQTKKCHIASADLVVCFEVFEHVYSPFKFLKAAANLVRPGGLMVLSTLSIDGFDLQTLWNQSTQINPPHHLNFYSLAALKKIFLKSGFSDIKITTPGRLDIDIVCNALLQKRIKSGSIRFFSKIAEETKVKIKFQKFLVANKLSSHAWVVAFKPFL